MSFPSLFILHAILLCACLAHGSKGSELNEKGGLDESVERLIQDEIGRKIERIKQEIKEEIERRERNRLIEANNRKFEELQREELLENGLEQRQGELKTDSARDNSDVIGNEDTSQAEDETLRKKRDELLLGISGVNQDLEKSSQSEGDSPPAQLYGTLGSGTFARQGNFLFQGGEEARLDGPSQLSERGRDARKFRRPYRKLRRRRRKIRAPRRRIRRRKNGERSKVDSENNLASAYAGTFPEIVHKSDVLSRYKRV